MAMLDAALEDAPTPLEGEPQHETIGPGGWPVPARTAASPGAAAAPAAPPAAPVPTAAIATPDDVIWPESEKAAVPDDVVWPDQPEEGGGALSVFGREAAQTAVSMVGEAMQGLGTAPGMADAAAPSLGRSALELALFGPLLPGPLRKLAGDALLGPVGTPAAQTPVYQGGTAAGMADAAAPGWGRSALELALFGPLVPGPLRKLAGDALLGPVGTPTAQTPVYQAGQAVKKWGEETFPVTPQERQQHPIASTMGGLAGGVGPVIAISALDPAAGLAFGAAEFGLGGAGSVYEAAKAKGADDTTAYTAAALNSGLNIALGTTPVGNVLRPFMRYLPEAMPWAVRKLAQMGENGITFAGAGEAQTALGQQIAKLYDPNAHYSFDVNRLLGELMFGGAMGAIHRTPRPQDTAGRGTITVRAGGNESVGPGGPGGPGGTPVDQLRSILEEGEEPPPGAPPAAAGESILEGEPPPPTGRPPVEDYVSDAMRNLGQTSRTAQGTLDTSSTPGKADQMTGVSARDAAALARQNYDGVIRNLYDNLDVVPTSGADMADFIDRTAAAVNHGIVRPDALERTADTKFPMQTAAADLPVAHAQFSDELAARLADPYADPVETAAWIEWRSNLIDHFWADGVGKTSKALAAIPLMRAGYPLPRYPSNREFVSYASEQPRVDPREGGEAYLGPAWDRFNEFYHGLVEPPVAQQRANLKAMLADPNVSVEQLERHPLVRTADEKYRSIPPTGTPEDFANPEWRAARTYDFGGTPVQGWDAAVDQLADHAKAFSTAAPVENGRRAIIVLGPPAAGKSTVSEQLARSERAALVDPDEAKKVIPEYRNGLGTGAVHEESSHLAREVFVRLGATGSNMVLPKVGDSFKGMKGIVDRLKQLGYRVDIVNVAATPEISRRRNIARFLETGRLVTPEYIRDVGDKPRDTAYMLKGDANDFLDINTAQGFQIVEGTGPLAEVFRVRSDLGPATYGGTGRTAGAAEGAPEQGLIGTPPPGLRPHRVSTSDGMSVQVAPVVVEAASLRTSQDYGYDPTLQPRNRDRAAANAQVRNIATNLDPERLGYSSEADRGAPIVGSDHMVESGNGRVLALRRVYDQNGAQAQAYRDWLTRQGVNVDAYREPILVRQRLTPLTPEERRAFTVAANRAATLAMSAPERAMSDARLLDAHALDLIRNPEDLGAAANRPFFRRFVSLLPQAEQGVMADARGALSAEGLARARNAILAKAYGDDGVLTRIAESTDDDVKSISNALVAVAPAWARLRAEVEAGRVRPDMDVTPELVEAVKRTADLRGRGAKLDTFLQQQDAFDRLPAAVEGFMRAFYDPKGRAAAGTKRIKDALAWYAQEAAKASAEPDLGLGLVPVEPRAIIGRGTEKAWEDVNGREGIPNRGGAGYGAYGEASRGEVRGPGLGAGREGPGAAGERGYQEEGIRAQRPSAEEELEILARQYLNNNGYLTRPVAIERFLTGRLGRVPTRDEIATFTRLGHAYEARRETERNEARVAERRRLEETPLDAEGMAERDRLTREIEDLGFDDPLSTVDEDHQNKLAAVADLNKLKDGLEDEAERVREEVAENERLQSERAQRRVWIDNAAARLKAEAERLGASVERDRSGLSEATYLKIYPAQDDLSPLKIRISDHDPRPTYQRMYGAADLEVGDNQTAHIEGAGEDVDAAVRWLRAQLGGDMVVKAQRPTPEDERRLLERAGQTVLPGAERISSAELAQRRAAEPLRPRRDQLPTDFGLFGETAPQGNLNLGENRPTFGPTQEAPNADLLGRPEGTGVRGGPPQVSPRAQPRRAPRVLAKRPAQLSLFGGGGGEHDVPSPDGGQQQGNAGPSVPGQGEGVTKPPTRGGRGGAARPRVPTTPRGAGRVEAEHKIAERSRSNYRITPEDQIGVGGPKQKVRANLDAIRTLKRIEDEARQATPAEKAILVKYVGWGAFAQDMFSPYKKGWEAERDELRALLNEDEFTAARESTLNAHFTSPDVVRGMWDVLDHMGFAGGQAIEPAAGIGHFIGMIPDKVAPKTAWTAVELDPLSGRLTKALYGGADVNVMGFEQLKRPSNYYDLAISNVPFGDYNISEKPYGSFPIHNFFFVKSLDKVRPGGVVAFITSRYTMDAVDPSTRLLLAKNADLVGAIRLPGGRKGAFAGNAGTEVTTDVLFLRKKVAGEPPFPGAAWENLKEVQTPEGPANINEYFADRPQMMMGEMRLQGTMYRPDEPMLSGEAEGLRERMAAAAAAEMPQGVFLPRDTPPPPPITGDEIGAGIKDGAFFLKDGKLYQRREGQGFEHPLSPDDHDRVTRLIGMRDTLNDLLASQIQGAAHEKNEALRENLRNAYDDFVRKHGPINKETRTITSRLNREGEPVVIMRQPNLAKFRDDPDAWKVAAIEDYDAETGKARRAAIQTKDVIGAPKERQINGPSDALAASLDDTGTVDLDHIAQSLNLATIEEAALALGDTVYQNPDGRQWETADKYLSGNVVQKLEDARAIAQENPAFLRNVAVLERVQPEPIPGVDITAQFGAPWVPPDVYESFLSEIGVHDPKVTLVPITGDWRVKVSGASGDAQAKYATNRVDIGKIITAAFNNGQITVRDRQSDGSSVVNAKATEEARAKVEALKEDFAGNPEHGIDSWAFADPERAQRLEGIFNRTYNNLAPRLFDGSHLTLPGLNPDFATRQHRKDAVWRMIQNGNTLLAHVVGSGKAQPLDAKVLTPSGWKRMGDIVPGNTVIAGDGSPARVLGVYPQGEKDIYRVTFSDGASTECCDEHLWFTHTYRERSYSQRAKKIGRVWDCGSGKVRSLSEIRTTLVSDHLGAKNHSIPVVGTVQFSERALPLDPYLVGVLIGDGCLTMRHVIFSTADNHILTAVSNALPADCELVHRGAYDYAIAYRGKVARAVGARGSIPSHPIKNALVSLGLMGCYAHEKRIPESYLHADVEARVELLRGLMDTDGTVCKKGVGVSFTTVSTGLADDVADLIRSLGGLATRRERLPKGGNHKAITLQVAMPPHINPFALPRKADRVHSKSRYAPARYIVDVQSVGRKAAQCIAIDHPSHLYVTDDYIVTHNTATMQAGGMEMKRLGLINKPGYVIPNHMLEQFSREFLQAYPNAKILVAQKDEMTREHRKAFLAKVSANDWDGVVITHDAFGRINMGQEYRRQFIRDQLDELSRVLQAEKASGGKSSPAVKNLESAKKKLQERLTNLMNEERKDEGTSFEESGIDFLFVDEAHCFPYGALVLTDRGPMPIGEIVENRSEVKVASLIHATGRIEWRSIHNYWRHDRTGKQFIRIRTKELDLCCTTNHQIFVEGRGYVRADSIREGEVLRILPAAFRTGRVREGWGSAETLLAPMRKSCGQKIGPEDMRVLRATISIPQFRKAQQRQTAVLRESLRGEMAYGATGTDGKIGWADALGNSSEVARGHRISRAANAGFLRTDACAQSNDDPRCAGKTVCRSVGKDVPGSWGQWQTDQAATGAACANGVADGVCHPNQASAWKIFIPAKILQGRFGRPRTEISSRGGWKFASNAQVEVFGQAQDLGSECTRVVGIEIIERGSDGEPRSGGAEDRFVYDLGIEGEHNYFADGVLVHNSFKNLNFITRLGRVKGLAQGDSQRAEDLFLKLRYLEEKRPGRSAVFATGTPVSNTMAELWTMMRYLEPDKLKERGLDLFDAWANTFGRVATETELSADGRTFKDVSSFSRFVNIPELISLYSEIADTKTADMLNLPRPDVKTRSGAPGIEIVEATPSSQEEEHIQKLVALAESLKGKRPKKGEPNMLSVVTAGRKVATDGRLISGDFDFNPQGKIAKAIDNISRIYKEGNKDPSAPNKVQMVFLDMGVPQTRSRRAKPRGDDEGEGGDPAQTETPRIDLYADIKKRLVEKGIPAREIAAIHDATDDNKKAKLFAKVRSGEIRVLLGSSEKMGVGTNVQDRLIAMHHLDAPWKPAEVEQRDGRIQRQGNLNPNVQIYRYVTKRSFDAFMWQTLDRKAKFIGQVLSGSKGSRHAEDIDNPLPEAAEMKAAASGDPRILEHAELDRELRSLTVQRRSFETTKSRAYGELSAAKSRIQSYEAALPNAHEDAAAVTDLAGDKFVVDLGGTPVTNRAEAGKAILEGLRSYGMERFYTPKLVKVGTMSGFDMNVELRAGWDGVGTVLRATPSLKGKSGYASPNDTVINEHTDPAGLMRRFENILNNIRQNPDRLTRELANERTSVGKLEKTISQGWPREKAYREALAKLDALTKAMKAPEHPDVTSAKAEAQPEDEGTGQGFPMFRRGRDEGRPGIGPGASEKEVRIGKSVVAHVKPSEAYTAHERELSEAVNAIIQKMAPKANVLSATALRLEGRPVFGMFLPAKGMPDLIAWSLERFPGEPSAQNTVRHEIVHHLRRNKLIRPDEWKALEDKAVKDDWIGKYDIDRRYPTATRDEKIEEAAADHFGQWRGDRGLEKQGLIRDAFQRLDLLLRRVAAAARRLLGKDATADDIFTRIETGEVGRREPEEREKRQAAATAAAPAAPAGAMPRTSLGTTAAQRVSQSKRLNAFKRAWASMFQPELVSDRAFEADPLFAAYRSGRANGRDLIFKLMDNDWQYWNKQPQRDQLRFIDEMERGRQPADPTQAAMATAYKRLIDANYQAEKAWGSKAAFIQDYFPHIWERPQDWNDLAATRTAQVGPTWFQKERTIEYIQDGLNAGLKLRYSNPVDMLSHRFLSGVDMRLRMELLNNLKKLGLAWEGKQGGDQLVKRGWRAINAPDRKQWVIAPDVQLLWKNAVEAKGYWQDAGLGGRIFRGWMALKNVWVPIRLTLSAFHPLHVLHIDQANSLALAWDKLRKGGDLSGAMKSAAEAAATLPTLGAIHYRRGAQARQAWLTAPGMRTPEQKADVKLMTEGGFRPQLAEEMKIGAKRQLQEAWQKIQRKEANVSDWRRWSTAGVRHGIEKFQAPIFEKWIPALKAAAYLNQASALLQRRPELLRNEKDRRIALRTIAKSIDNRYGEMNYDTLFWDRYVKDAGIASFLSLGWNLGFAREFLGAAGETGAHGVERLLGKAPTANRKVARDASNKLAFATAYVGTAMLLAGAMSYLFTGQRPDGLDFIFPRIGGENPDGSPRRVTTMFYTREVPMLLKHVQERGGNWLTGSGEMLWNKLMFEPFAELLNNRNYYGYDIWDANAPLYKQMWQGLTHTLANQLSPMTISGASHAAQLSGHEFPGLGEALTNPSKLGEAVMAKGVGMSMLGFGPAPAYVEKTPLQNRIGFLFGRYVAPGSRPEEMGENTEARMAVRAAILNAKRIGDSAALNEATKRATALGMSPRSIKQIGEVPSDVYMFSRLPAEMQKGILAQASTDEWKRYWPRASKKVKAEIAKEQREKAAKNRAAGGRVVADDAIARARGGRVDGTKIDRSAFLYLEKPNEKDFAQCGECSLFTPDHKCAVIGIPVEEGWSCGLFVPGRYDGTKVAHRVSAKDAGLVKGQVRCENCRYGGKTCALYERLNREFPSEFDLDTAIKPHGCCNAFTAAEPGAVVPARANGGRVDPRNINHEPTEAQKRSGVYAKDHLHIHGLPLTIENAKGSMRRGVGRDGKPWACMVPAHYGYIRRTEGADGDHLDIYLGPHQKSPHVFLVDQIDADTGRFDETKAMLGFGSRRQALDCYRRAFSDGKGEARIGKVTEMTVPQFKLWLVHGDTRKPFPVLEGAHA